MDTMYYYEAESEIEARRIKARKERRRRARRLKKIKQNIIFSVVCVAVIGIAFLLLNIGINNYNKKMNLWTYVSEGDTIVYCSYEIESGDTLTSIAHDINEKYCMEVPTDVMIHNICRINHIYDSNNIKYGNYIIIPYFTLDED